MKRNSIVLILLLVTSSVFSQDVIEKKWALKISPQHFLHNTMKFEIEKVITDRQLSLIVSPVYVAKEMWTEKGSDKVWGAGGEFMGRIYFAKNHVNFTGFYTSFGFNYHFYETRTFHNDWNELKEDGLTFLKYGKKETEGEIHRLGALMLIGYQINIKNKVIFDFYQGLGMRRSFSPQGDMMLKRFDSHFLNYGFTGIDPRIGVKIGFAL